MKRKPAISSKKALSKPRAYRAMQSEIVLPLDAAEAHYSLDNLSNKVLAAEYQTILPNEKLIADERKRSIFKIERRPSP